MASASKKSNRITTVLELEPEEVVALLCIFYHCGGSTSCSGRIFSDRIYNALIRLFPDFPNGVMLNDVSGFFHFNDDTINKIRKLAEKYIN